MWKSSQKIGLACLRKSTYSTQMDTMKSLFRFSIRRTAIAVLATLAAVPIANAGTYSVVGIQWYPTSAPGTFTGGGYINFGVSANHQNPLDVYYGINASVTAPWFSPNGEGPPIGHPSAVGYATCQGNFQWIVQWTASGEGDTPPGAVTGIALYTGSGSVTCAANDYGATGSALGSVLDTFYAASGGVTASYPGDFVGPITFPSGLTSPQALSVGGTFTYVSPGVYQAYFADGVNDIATLTANGGLEGLGLTAWAQCSTSLNVVISLYSVGGQVVN